MKINLKELRKRKGWSIRKLSLKTGIAKGYLSEIEHGKYKNVGAIKICILCDALNCTPNDLIKCKGEDEGGGDIHSKRSSEETADSSGYSLSTYRRRKIKMQKDWKSYKSN